MSCEHRAGLHKLPKPKLRGHCMAAFHRQILIAVGLGGAAALIFNMLYCRPRQQRYVDFHKTYDPIKDEERMTALGLFQSACEVSNGSESAASSAGEPVAEEES
ncbi:hypothetical protein L9F63_000235 [Diploptera punctata]|uniref:Mitochondrial cytochrome c oxidase subunit VIc/VIIs domain-containing protein n=1 Tax=Diploptera punctata TaxID=6984 RepID=A0AAD8AM41_DIPPU|nr:hypothetical protein L9F63_000235 [Diploptera punctata]